VLAVDVPGKGVDRARVLERVALEPALEQPHDRRLRRTDRTVQQDHAPFGSETARAGADRLHQAFERRVEAVDRVLAALERIVEDPPAPRPALGRGLAAMALDHVDQPLPRVARDQRLALRDLQVVAQPSLPVQGRVAAAIAMRANDVEQRRGAVAHDVTVGSSGLASAAGRVACGLGGDVHPRLRPNRAAT
jgi:hypothetical protein